MKKPLSLYLHIPFCKRKCNYCDFLSFDTKENHAAYGKGLCKEIMIASENCQDYLIESIFIGGGTPTVMPVGEIEKIMGTIFQYYSIAEDAEITIEANPATVNEEKLSALYRSGINRLSFGVQAWQDKHLKKLGRLHTAKEFAEDYKIARKVGFQNISTDLMFSLPDQTLEDWKETLDRITELEPQHISCYSLIVEEGTPFYRSYKEGNLSLPSEELDREMYETAKEYLKDKGYRQYEISNFAKPGYESRHNKVYWLAQEYLGLGLGAHSYFHGQRFHNTESLEAYICYAEKGEYPKEEVNRLTKEDQISEFMFLGLRLMEGIAEERFFQRFGYTLDSVYGRILKELVNRKLLALKDGRYFLTSWGIDVSNQVFEQFLL